MLKNIRQFGFNSQYLKDITEIKDVEDLHTMNLEQLGSMGALPDIDYVVNSILRKFVWDESRKSLEIASGMN